MIRWSPQHGLVVIPTSVARERIIRNTAVLHFELDPADMDALDALDEGVHYARDPTATP